MLRCPIHRGRAYTGFTGDIIIFIPLTRPFVEQVAQIEIDAGAVAMTASVSGTDSQGVHVDVEAGNSVSLDRQHGIYLGELYGLDLQPALCKDAHLELTP